MAAAYEAFLQRIQDGLNKEEEEQKAAEIKAKQEEISKPIEDVPPLLEEDEDEELPIIEPVPLAQETPDIRCSGTTNLKELYDEICQTIRAHDTLDAIMQDFQGFRTDYERVSYVAQLTELENLEIDENYSQKSHEDACNYEKVYDLLIPNEASAAKALDVMKKCIQKTPPDETSALATRYMKRGWAFLLLEQFKNAALDAKKSLTYGSNEESLWNSYEILGHTHAQVKDYKQSEYHFLKALENLRKSNTANEVKASVTVRIMTVFKTIKSAKTDKKNKNTKPNSKQSDASTLPNVSYGPNKSFPKASSAVDFVFVKGKGRCAIANRNIKPGDVLIVDSPYATMMNPDFITTHCYNCYSRLNAPVPCNSCAKVWYCSDECRTASWDGLHSKECKILNHLLDPGIGKMALLSYRVLTTLTWSRLQKLREKIDKVVEDEIKEEIISPFQKENTSKDDSFINPIKWDGPYEPDDYETVFRLESNASKRSFGDLFQRSITAVYLAKCLKFSGYFSQDECSEEDLLFVAGMVLRHLQGGSCNAYEISELYFGPNGLLDATLNEIGGAFYTTISMTNHACFSNTARYSIGDKCVLRAVRGIPKGGEIFDNYGFYYYLQTCNERQEALLHQYKFKCECPACSSMWSMYPHHPTETLIFRCPAPDCGQACCYSSTVRVKCNLCGNQKQYGKLLKDLEVQLLKYKDAVIRLKQGIVTDTISTLCDHMDFLDQNAIPPVKHYSDVQEAIKQCFNCMGNVHKIAEPIVTEVKPQERTIKCIQMTKAGNLASSGFVRSARR